MMVGYDERKKVCKKKEDFWGFLGALWPAYLDRAGREFVLFAM